MSSQSSAEFIRVSSDAMRDTFARILTGRGFTPAKASACADVFTANSVDGVYTHGVNRFPRFVSYADQGYVRHQAEPICVHQAGALEQWDGQLGPGPLNAIACTDRAMAMASQHGIGCVALANTNHWMRGGTYGWRAAKSGCVFIGWTNTTGNMPAWGAVDNRLGNNPLVIAVPHGNEAIVLDMAMSQYSYGALEWYEMKNEKLPVPGGFDSAGKLTQEPAAIRESKRILPAGYWKGAGLSLLLDVLATILSAGQSTAAISRNTAEYNVSQVFVAIDLHKLARPSAIAAAVAQIIDDYHQSAPLHEHQKVLFPGEKVLMTRRENSVHGIPVLKPVWEKILSL